MEQAMYRPNRAGRSIVYLDGTRHHDAYQGNASSQSTPNEYPNFYANPKSDSNSDTSANSNKYTNTNSG